MEIIALALVSVGLAAVYAWWDVSRARADKSALDGAYALRFEQHEKRINALALTVSHVEEQLLDTRNSVAGIKGLQTKVRKYG